MNLCPTVSLVKAIVGAQDITLYAHFHLSLNTLNVYS